MRAAVVAGALMLVLGLAPAPLHAKEEFKDSWAGLRLGAWYRPHHKMVVQANGRDPNPLLDAARFGTKIDIERDLDLSERPHSDFMFRPAILEAEFLLETRWVSVSVWSIAPSRYEDRRFQLQRDIAFGDAASPFTSGTFVKSKFSQWQAGVELRVNIFNDEIFKLAPIVGLRVFGFDWEIRSDSDRGKSEQLDTPGRLGDDRTLPYPELGFEVRVGYRQYVEADLRVTGSMGSFFDYEAFIVNVDAGINFWIYDVVGVRAGYRFYKLDGKSKHESRRDSFDINLELYGPTVSIQVKFG